MSEHDEQVALFEWADLMSNHTYPALKLLFSIPNGGKRTKGVAGKLTAEGLKSGVPDVMLAYPSGPYSGLFVELKYGKNKLTANQKVWCEALAANGYRVVTCYGFDAARAAIEEYLNLGDNNGNE